MNYRNFEKNIKDTLYDAEADLDINQFILDLHSKKGKSPKGLYLLFGLIGLSFIAVSLYFLNSSERQITAMPSNIMPSTIASNDASHYISHTSSPDLKPMTVSNHSSIVISNKETPNASLTSNTSPTINKDNTYVAIKGTLLGAQKNNFTTIEIEKNGLYEQVPSIKRINDVAIDEPTNFSNSSSSKLINTELKPDETYSSAINAIALLPRINSSLKTKDTRITLAYTKDIKCPTFAQKSPLRFSIIPEIGYFLPIKSLSSTSTEPSEIFTLRDKNEQTLEGIQAALYLQVQKNSSPFYFRAGVNYAQLTEKMKLDYTFTKRDTTIGITSITKSQTGDTITFIYGDIITETQRQGTKIGHHKFQLCDIPVSVGYEKSFNGFNLGAEIGASFNISLTASGKMLGTSTKEGIVFKDIASNSPYKSNLGINYFGSIFISKELFENQSIYAALRGRIIPGQFTQSGTPVAEKYSMVGLHLGYKVSF